MLNASIMLLFLSNCWYANRTDVTPHDNQIVNWISRRNLVKGELPTETTRYPCTIQIN